MTRIGSRALAALAVLALQACGGDDVVAPRPPVDIVFATIIQGGYWSCAECDASAARVLMFATEESWRSFWEDSERDIASAPGNPPPAVDFQHEVVLALLDKAEPKLSRIEIASVRRESDRVVVRATVQTGCWEWWLPSPPFRAYHIVRINRRMAPVDLYVTDVRCP